MPARCRKCHRILTTPAAVEAGYGPVCYAKEFGKSLYSTSKATRSAGSSQETGQSATLMKNASQIKNRGLETYIFLQVQTCGAYPQPGECEGEEDVL